MATKPSSEQQKQLIDDLISCAICFDHYEDPRILPCAHTFCLKCIRKVVADNHGRFQCPMRDGTEIEENRIDSLPINRVLPDIVDFLRNLNVSDQNAERCKYMSYEILVWSVL